MTNEAPKTTREAILAEIDKYLANNPHMSEEGFGWLTIKSTSLVPRLRAGGDITTRKLDAIIHFMATHRSIPEENKNVEGSNKDAKKAGKRKKTKCEAGEGQPAEDRA